MSIPDASLAQMRGERDSTGDLTDYCHLIRFLPPLSEEERDTLILQLADVQASHLPTPEPTQAQDRLIEGHLWLGPTLASKWCPACRRALLPDLVQEANQKLVALARTFDYRSGKNFTAYAIVALSAHIRAALHNDTLIRIPRTTRNRMRQDGRADQLEALLPLSLDMVFESEQYGEEESLGETFAEPHVPLCDAQEHTRKHQQVEALLSHLSPRAAQVLRLCFGLFEDDGRPRSPAEIADLLAIPVHAVHTAKQQALARLRTIAEGQTGHPVQRKHGPSSRSERPSPTTRLGGPRPLTDGQQRLERAWTYLEAQHLPITAARLARLAAVHFITADRFLQRRMRPVEGAERSLTERLEQAYTQLQATGKRVTAYALAKQVDVHPSTAQRFLLAHENTGPQNPHARCVEHLERAYAALQEEGVPLTVNLLARRAGVHYHTARAFVAQRQPTDVSPVRQATGPRRNPEIQAPLEQAYAHMQAEGKAISERGLARRAGVSRSSARRFLKQQASPSQDVVVAEREVCYV
jgi:RNA polymerase sigma factor (sigma-70 family)